MISVKRLLKKSAHPMLAAVVASDSMRKVGLEYAIKKLYASVVKNSTDYSRAIRYERYLALRNLLLAINRHLSNDLISTSVRDKLLKVFIGKIFTSDAEDTVEKFQKKYDRSPPGFMTISPEKKCNLKCADCYAASSGKVSRTEHLDYDTFDRIITEKTRLWGSHFTVISGGEPLLWRSDGKDIFDIFHKHDDNYFMMYTNGILISREVARQMAELGNITPAVSLEGFEEETDARRGKGIFKKILKTMGYLREAGVPFGISVTATRHNAEELLSDEFVDFFFEEQGAIYGWMFQYMPIGRHPSLDLMVTPEQRRWMFEREKRFLSERKIFYPDFWNSGALSGGCIAAGRPGGYLYVEWNGNVTPCVFFPYSVGNIRDVYARGGTLNDVIESELFKKIRHWQRDYGYGKCGKEIKNWIAPCSIRDHYANASRVIKQTAAIPIDEYADESINDPSYYEGLVKYNKEFRALTDDLWGKLYINPE